MSESAPVFTGFSESASGSLPPLLWQSNYGQGMFRSSIGAMLAYGVEPAEEADYWYRPDHRIANGMQDNDFPSFNVVLLDPNEYSAAVNINPSLLYVANTITPIVKSNRIDVLATVPVTVGMPDDDVERFFRVRFADHQEFVDEHIEDLDGQIYLMTHFLVGLLAVKAAESYEQFMLEQPHPKSHYESYNPASAEEFGDLVGDGIHAALCDDEHAI